MPLKLKLQTKLPVSALADEQCLTLCSINDNLKLENIKHHQSAKGGSFNYEVNGEKLAEMGYIMNGDSTMIIEHTDVDDSVRGKGIGRKLLSALVDYARENNIHVVPLCPFANATFQKTREWQDVLVNLRIKHKH